MKLCMGCMEEIEDHLSTCPYCGFNETALRQESYYLDPGTVIGGKYIAGRVLSYGGHTVSYLGWDAEYNRKVIVKEYLPSDFSTRSEGEKDVTIYSGDGQEQFEQGLTNFLNESNRIQHLQDVRGIARVYDCVAENDTGYVISEYVQGRTLKEIMDGGKKYSPEEAAAFIRTILQGLSGIHRMDIIHCDISPDTIMVTDTGDIKLTDFGATRYVTTANSKSLSIILKRGYAPEEQYRSRGVRGPWTDVYALGAVMYQMITGRIPQESVERALSDDLKEPSKLGIAIPHNMENALMNALNVYQEDRTPSAEAFLRELNSADVKRTKVKTKKKRADRFPIWAKGLVAVLVCVVIAGGVYLGLNRKNSDTKLVSNAVTMLDFGGQTLEDIQEQVDAWNEEYGWNITVSADETVFSLTDTAGTAASQSIAAGVVLYDPKAEDAQTETGTGAESDTESEARVVAEGLTADADGKLTGTIAITLYSDTYLRYSDISGMNAYEIARKLDVDTEGGDSFEGIESDSDENDYYDLVSIEADGQVIDAKSLDAEANQNKTIRYDKEKIKITYYASDFFYWEELPDFTSYGNIDNLPEQDVWRYSDENTREKAGTKSLKSSSLVDDSYFVLEGCGYEVGDIVGQTVDAGEEYDASNPGDTQLEIQVVGYVIEYKGKTGSELADELSSYGFAMYGYMDAYGNTGSGSWDISTVAAYPNDRASGYSTDEILEYFAPQSANDESIFFEIIVKAPETEARSSSGGSSGYSGGSSSGYSGGGGSSSGGSSGDENGRDFD